MEPSKRSRSVQIVEIFSLSLQLIAIVSPGWVGELHPDSSFYSSLFYGVICDLECKIQSHHTTYSTARRESSSDKAVAGEFYYYVKKQINPRGYIFSCSTHNSMKFIIQ